MAKAKKIDLNKVLKKETAARFKVVKLAGMIKAIYPGFGLVDFRTITPKQADNLIARGFPYLEVKPKKKPKQSTEDKD